MQQGIGIMKIKYYLSKAIKKFNIPAIKNSALDKHSKICSGAHIVDSKIGKYSYIGNFSTVINAQVGNFCSISDRCTIGGMAHPTNWVSTSPVMYSGRNCLKTNFAKNNFNESEKTIIDNDVWIGENCLIKAGVHISTGSIIGMGSVLTKSTAPYEIWAGNPAKKIRDRFDNETTKKLLKSEWWNWDDKELAKKGYKFNDVNLFISESEGISHE